MIRALFLSFLAIGLGVPSKAQDRTNYYFVVDGRDTVQCRSMSWRPSDKRTPMRFIRWEGTQEETMDREASRRITTLFQDGYVQERVPVKASAPDGRLDWMQRVANGKVRLYARRYSAMVSSTATVSGIDVLLRMPDGLWIDVETGSGYRKKAEPIFSECAEYRSKYAEPFDWNPKADVDRQLEQLIERVSLYNGSCAPSGD